MSTLIEKLERERDLLHKLSDDFIHDTRLRLINEASGICKVINIVKQHQTWRKMPSDEKPQDMQAYNLLLKTDSTEYPKIYSVGLFREYKSGHVWLSLVEAETYIDESDILAWQPVNMPSAEFFESPKQPPSEVQDD